jgi:hypothetical protein
MPMRRATHSYTSIAHFVSDHEGPLREGFLLLPPEAVTDEPVNPLKLDLQLPLVGRVGPITAQVVSRTPEGGLALRLPDLQSEAGAGFQRLFSAIDEVRAWLQESGQLTAPAPAVDTQALEERLAELEDENQALREAVEALSAAVDDGPHRGEDGLESASLDEGGGGLDDELVDDELVDDELVEDDDRGDDELVDDLADGDAAPAAPAAAAPQAAGARPRGFLIPDLRAVSPRLSGALGGLELQDALVTLAVDRATGLFTARGADGRVRTGFWDKGGPVGFRTDPMVETEVLGVLLLRAQQITEAQLRQSLELMRARGCRQGEAFIEMGVMSYPQLIMVLGKQVEYLFTQLLAMGEGTFTFHDLPALPEPFLPPGLRIPNLLFRRSSAKAKELRSEELAAHFKPNINAYVGLHPEARRLLHDVKLSEVERKLVSIIDETNLRLREVFSVSPISRAATACMIYALDELKVLQYDGGESRAGYLARAAEVIAKKKRQLARCTEFDVLEVHWISLQDEIDAAVAKVTAEYAPSAFKDLPAELMEDLVKINERIRHATAVLKDGPKRREYRKSILEAFMIEQSAELLGRKGEMAIMRHDRREAVACFAKAQELDPRNPEYAEGLARSQAI